jgi:16S rRNA G966 N2-methylase RsmD
LSFEALSRGAKQVISIEKDTQAFCFLEHNKPLLKTNNLTLVKQDAFVFLDKNFVRTRTQSINIRKTKFPTSILTTNNSKVVIFDRR